MASIDRPGGAREKWLATATAMVGTFSMVLAATILNVALPGLMRIFAVDQQTVQWLVTGFLAAMTTAMVANAWCVERFGIRTTYVAAMVVFCAGSVLGACSPDIGWLIVARILQGAAAGLIQPLGMLVIFRVFAEGERGKGFGIYGLGVILAPAIAPVIGGLLVDLVSWRATFLIALPACAVGLPMALAHLPGRDDTLPVRRLDVAGLVLLAGTLAVLLWALSSGPKIGWDRFAVQGGLIAGGLGLAAFLVWEWFAPSPLLELRVFRSPAFVGGFLLTLVLGGGLYASTYLIPLYLQQVKGMMPSGTGLLLLPGGLAMAATFPVAGWLTDRVARSVPILCGGALFIASCALMGGIDAATGIPWLLLWILVGRVGLGLMMPPVTAGSLLLLEPHEVPQASGAINFGRQLGSSLGVSLISIVLDVASGSHRDGFALLDEAARRAALAHGYDVAFLTLAGVFAVSLSALGLMRQSR
ncbi:MAG TPA: DHA2 family efflux MFS transporter permease subunit [Azospirillum sp.]|nr:DHA2 family efflux MFS transporter permease subunit [Azospirillum sp.]